MVFRMVTWATGSQMRVLTWRFSMNDILSFGCVVLQAHQDSVTTLTFAPSTTFAWLLLMNEVLCNRKQFRLKKFKMLISFRSPFLINRKRFQFRFRAQNTVRRKSLEETTRLATREDDWTNENNSSAEKRNGITFDYQNIYVGDSDFRSLIRLKSRFSGTTESNGDDFFISS